MAQSNAQRAEEQPAGSPARRPEFTVKVGNVEIAVWKNSSDKGDFHTASAPALRYKDKQTGEWKDGSSYGPMDLLALSEAARETSAKIRELSESRR